MSLNRVVLVGRMGKGAELRETSTGKKVASFSVAVNRQFKKDESDWFSVGVSL